MENCVLKQNGKRRESRQNEKGQMNDSQEVVVNTVASNLLSIYFNFSIWGRPNQSKQS